MRQKQKLEFKDKKVIEFIFLIILRERELL